MNIGMAITIVAALAQAARAEQKLDVFVNHGELIPFVTFQSAKVLASRMLATADVRIAWHRGAPSEWNGQEPAHYYPNGDEYPRGVSPRRDRLLAAV